MIVIYFLNFIQKMSLRSSQSLTDDTIMLSPRTERHQVLGHDIDKVVKEPSLVLSGETLAIMVTGLPITKRAVGVHIQAALIRLYEVTVLILLLWYNEEG